MIERKIIIGLITSTEYLQNIHSILDTKLLESQMARKLADWCLEYFKQYKQAPGKDIEGIYYDKLKQGLQKDIAEEIEEDILPGLSNEYEQEGINIDYLTQQSKDYFNERSLIDLSEKVKGLVEEGDCSEAEKLILDFKPLSVELSKLDNYILSVQEIREVERPNPPLLLRPWIRAGQTTIIYGNYGSGKSLLTLVVAYILGLKEYDNEDCEIQTWQVKHPTGCLYIDGELGEQEMEERIQQFEWLGKQSAKHRIQILSIPEYQIATEDSFYLSVRTNQLKIIKWLEKHSRYKLLVLDSTSTLFGLDDENDNSEWSKKINPFLRDLRALGVACLLLHHSGKDGKRGLRGASAMGAMAHNIFKLTAHPDKDIDKGSAWFNITKDKQRTRGFSFKAFGLKFFQTDDDSETHWEVTDMK